MSDASPVGDGLWVKVIGMLQQNWAVIEVLPDGTRVRFVDDLGRVFDELRFGSPAAAAAALRRNGFECFNETPELQAFLIPPSPPFNPGSRPNPIYSSGKFWL